MKTLVLSSLVVLGLSGTAFAQAAVPDFATLDADANGSVSLSEAQVAFPNLTPEAYSAADTDADGELSSDEFGLAAGATISTQ
jgi:hypothetical protein